ncbi:MAG TPA: glucose-6-phosphate dehydrogenase [Bryobacteraceae bacterium]|nr:glucose-6-phosphate dehydrogenase [Bryobacteraceae bacterium]
MTTTIEAQPTGQVSRSPLPQGESCLLVIFGASGDLTRRKLIPSLYNLGCAGCIHRQFEVLGVSRTPMTGQQFRSKMGEAASKSSEARDFDSHCWQDFERRLHYLPGDINQPEFFHKLRAHLEQMQQSGASPNHLFYLSTPASEARPIIEGLRAAGLSHGDKGWARVIVEKPFGHNLDSARQLNNTLAQAFDEREVYRIDHFVGKETVQNLLVFRFGNSLFEPVWNRNYIDHVEIAALETLGVEGRASFYEETGALRDMVANHLLQLLALTAMEAPVAFDAESIRVQKVQLFHSIRPMTVQEVAKRTVRGQYGPGQVDGKPVPGYRQEPNVKPNSNVETYAAIDLHVDNWRWAGVPFYIRTGKRLDQRGTEIRVHLKRTPQALFAATPDEEIEPNVIAIRIQPDEGISIAFGAKHPGTEMRTVTVQANFSYPAMFGTGAPTAYETLLLDAMRGDPTLFTHRDEVEAEWRIIDPIEQGWAQLPPPEFPNYAAGSSGPRAS